MKLCHFLVCIPLFSFGCTTIPTVTTNITMLHSAYQSRASDCEIKILTQMPIDQKYEELAIFSSITDEGSFTHKDLDSRLPSIKAKACAIGADAIVIKNVEAGGLLNHNSGGQTPGKAYSVAIKLVN
jgi:hypothetical protein